jgi:hypothetical protein
VVNAFLIRLRIFFLILRPIPTACQQKQNSEETQKK